MARRGAPGGLSASSLFVHAIGVDPLRPRDDDVQAPGGCIVRPMARALTLCCCVLALTFLASSSRATVLPDWGLDEIVRASDVIVKGTVREVEIENAGGQLITRLHVDVDETLLGKRRTSVVVWQHGGTRGGKTAVTSRVKGDVTLQEGDRVVLALFKETSGAAPDPAKGETETLRIVGLSLGAWAIDDDESVLSQDISVPLASETGIVVEAPGRREIPFADLVVLTDAERARRIGRTTPRARPPSPIGVAPPRPAPPLVDAGAMDDDAVEDDAGAP